MRPRLVLFVGALALVAASCGGSSDTQAASDAELVWCTQLDNSTVFDAIWDAADLLEVDSIGAFLLDQAGIETDVDPRELSAEDLTAEELAALSAVGEEFDATDVLWLEYINSPDGARACIAAYASVNG
jgi:ABC-type glycerol-3-phosphate transport system substrate-binding protein